MTSRFVVLNLVFLALLAVSVASATEVSFSLSGIDPVAWSSAGTLSLTPDGSGQWLVTNASGNFDGTAITGVWPTTNNGSIFSFNNVLYSPGAAVDMYGIVFTLANNELVNLCYGTGCGNYAGYTDILWDGSSATFYNASEAAFSSPIPEPSTLLLTGGAVLGLYGVARRGYSG